ncbi:hypothetical protein GCM10011578_069380 [Streptomyces fuscichromogenes]|uniref:Uncharacterized protein n=1 Tax=Streptomyces fuscichromogenes TaxID=1324013 RepID=A0A917XJL3_9ACTN|nr:hypothetical protein GCM10011578_069380 [Streptomyces fuscichromogenes]
MTAADRRLDAGRDRGDRRPAAGTTGPRAGRRRPAAEAGQGAGAQGHPGPDQDAADGLGGTVGAGADERGGAYGAQRDEAGEEGRALRADPLHAHVPAHEPDDGDDGRLPQQRGRLRGVGSGQPRPAVEHGPGHRRLGRGEGAHGGGQQPWPERPQHRSREHREPDLAGQGAHREGEPAPVRPPPALDREGTGRDQRRPLEHPASGPSAVEERDQDRDHHRGAADEDARDRGFRGALGGEDRQVETDHPDGGEQGQPQPGARSQPAQPPCRAPPDERHEQQTGQCVTEELAARVRVVAQHTVGGEGAADEDVGERGQQGAAHGGRVHGDDARNPGGPD